MMRSSPSCRWLILVLLLVPLAIHRTCGAQVATSFTIASDGQPRAVIIVARKAANPLVIKYAAEELQRIIYKATGARLPIVEEPDTARSPDEETAEILIGPCRETERAGVGVAQLPANAFRIKTDGKRLFLNGKDGGTDVPRNDHVDMGTLFAVYEFLERQVGVRWLWPGDLGEYVPAHNRIVSGNWELKHVPHLKQRQWRFEASIHYGRQGWSSPNRVYDYKVDVYKWSRRHRFMRSYTLDYAEAFRDYWQRFGETHPEFFNLLPDGKRLPDGMRPGHVSMCVSEPNLWKQLVADWQRTRTPDLPWVNAKPNDTPGKCTCPRCRSWDVTRPGAAGSVAAARQAYQQGDRDGWTWPEQLGSLSDRYARYLLAVQQTAQQIDPNATVISYAYANYIRPPVATPLNRRVVIALASSLFFPYTQETSATFRRDWLGWSETGAQMVFRPNIPLGSHNLPVHYARRAGEDIQYAFAQGVLATDLDSLTGIWANQGPSLYVIARAQLRHDQPVDTILDEYYSAFGHAKSAVEAYFDHWEQTTERLTNDRWQTILQKYRRTDPDVNFRTFYKVAHEIYTDEVMQRGRDLLRIAAQAVVQDSLAAKRVAFLEKGLRDAQLTLDAQKAFVAFRSSGNRTAFTAALRRLQEFRHRIEREYVVNLSYVSFQENLTWQHLNP